MGKSQLGAEPDTHPAVQKGVQGFLPGKTGNLRGRPRGSRNKATLLAEALVDGEAEAVVRSIIEKAKNGDSVAQRLILDRLLPRRLTRPTPFKLPKIESAQDLPVAHDALFAAAAKGEVTLDEADRISGLLDAKRKAFETAELAEEIEALKRQCKAK